MLDLDRGAPGVSVAPKIQQAWNGLQQPMVKHAESRVQKKQTEVQKCGP